MHGQQSELGDLAALMQHAGGPSVLVGHSWGALLAQLAALRQPDLVAGLVLVDPADEVYWAGLSAEHFRYIEDFGATILAQHGDGSLAETVRDTFRPYATLLTGDPRLQSLILDAYASCYAKQSQAGMVQAEYRLFTGAVQEISRSRSAAGLPDVPVVVFSATTGELPEQRRRWTAIQAALAASAQLSGTNETIAVICSRKLVAAKAHLLV